MGVDSKYKQAFLKKQKEKAAVGKKLYKMKEKVSNIVKQSSFGTNDFRLNLFKRDWEKYADLHIKLRKEVEELEKVVYPTEDPTISVIDKVYPGVTIIIKHATYKVKTELSRILFKLKDNEVQLFNL